MARGRRSRQWRRLAPAAAAANNPAIRSDKRPWPADVSSTSLTITTRDPPSIESFTLTPSAYAQSSTVATVTWSTTDTESTRLSIGGQAAPGFPQTPSGTYSFDISSEANVVLLARNQVADVTATQQIVFGYDDSEPNDTRAQAIALPGDGAAVRGTLSTTEDVDTYAVMVPQGAALYARVDSPTEDDCAQLDPTVILLAADGTELGRRSIDSSGTRCAEIVPPEYAGYAENLSAGTYFVRVTGGSASAGQTYSLVVRAAELPAPLSNVEITRVGLPEWEVADFVQASTEFGTGPEFGPRAAAKQAILGTRHSYELGSDLVIGLPGQASVSNYGQELNTMIGLLGLENEEILEPDDITGGNGFFTGLTVLATGTSTGTSRDFPTTPGPVIRNALLPIDVAIGLTIGTDEYMVGGPVAPDPGVEGISHFHILLGLSDEVGVPLPAFPFDGSFRIQLRDQTDAGFDVTIPYRVQN